MLVNELRADVAGCDADSLTMNADVTAAAAECLDTILAADDISACSGTLTERLDAQGVTYDEAGESLGMDSHIHTALERMFESPDVGQYLLDCSFDRVGVAIGKQEDGPMYFLVFDFVY